MKSGIGDVARDVQAHFSWHTAIDDGDSVLGIALR
jgi:hypothetical protein